LPGGVIDSLMDYTSYLKSDRIKQQRDALISVKV